jgi:hypothetical protein
MLKLCYTPCPEELNDAMNLNDELDNSFDDRAQSGNTE